MDQVTSHTMPLKKTCAVVTTISHSSFSSTVCLVKHTILTVQSCALSRFIAHVLYLLNCVQNFTHGGQITTGKRFIGWLKLVVGIIADPPLLFSKTSSGG